MELLLVLWQSLAPTALIIGWILWVVFAYSLVVWQVGSYQMVKFFPEGDRWWRMPTRLLSMSFFIVAVAFCPLVKISLQLP